MDTIKFSLKVEREELYFVDNILKSYENLVFTTVEGVEGELGFLNVEVTEGTKEDVLKILDDLQNKVELEIIEKE